MTQLVIDVKLIDFESTSGGSALKISPGLSGMTSPIIGVEWFDFESTSGSSALKVLSRLLSVKSLYLL